MSCRREDQDCCDRGSTEWSTVKGKGFAEGSEVAEVGTGQSEKLTVDGRGNAETDDTVTARDAAAVDGRLHGIATERLRRWTGSLYGGSATA